MCISMRFLYGTALLLDICSEMLTLRKLTLLKFSLLARPARAASEYSEVLVTGKQKSSQIIKRKKNAELQGVEIYINASLNFNVTKFQL